MLTNSIAKRNRPVVVMVLFAVATGCMLLALRAMGSPDWAGSVLTGQVVSGTRLVQIWGYRDGDMSGFGNMEITSTIHISDNNHYKIDRVFGNYNSNGLSKSSLIVSNTSRYIIENRFDDEIINERIEIVNVSPPPPISPSEFYDETKIEKIANDDVVVVDIDDINELVVSNWTFDKARA